jgi:hypothetical protein
MACVDKSTKGAANNAPSNDSSLATWQELIATWDASSATIDDSDTLFIIMQDNGNADYLNYNDDHVCYEKTTVSLVAQGEGKFKHESSNITLTFTLNGSKTQATVSNNIDENSYVITKDNKTAQQLTPICNQTVVEPPADEVFINASMNDLVIGNAIWNASKAISDTVTDISYIVFTKEDDDYDDISFYDYKNDGVDGASSDCYEKLSSTIKDRGEGIFSNWLNANKLHIQVNETGDLLYATYVANNKSLLLTKEGVNNLTTVDFNTCP